MKIIKSTCGFCYAGCGVLVHVDNDKAVRIEGDPESPVNRGLLCEKALASLEYLYHPERLRYPLKRKCGAILTMELCADIICSLT